MAKTSPVPVVVAPRLCMAETRTTTGQMEAELTAWIYLRDGEDVGSSPTIPSFIVDQKIEQRGVN